MAERKFDRRFLSMMEDFVGAKKLHALTGTKKRTETALGQYSPTLIPLKDPDGFRV